MFEELRDYFKEFGREYNSAKEYARIKYGIITDATTNVKNDVEGGVKLVYNTVDKVFTESKGINGIREDITKSKKEIDHKYKDAKDNTRTIGEILNISRKKQSLATIAGDMIGKFEGMTGERQQIYDIKTYSDIINTKNKYFWKDTTQLQDIIEKEYNIKEDIQSILEKAMYLKTTTTKYSNLPKINYDSRIAPTRMYDEIINSYISSEKSLKEISYTIEKKYGMGISISTISRLARKHLTEKGYECKNRKEAKKIKH